MAGGSARPLLTSAHTLPTGENVANIHETNGTVCKLSLGCCGCPAAAVAEDGEDAHPSLPLSRCLGTLHWPVRLPRDGAGLLVVQVWSLVVGTDEGQQLYIWEGVPPTDDFVCLGMLATTTDSPPALSQVRAYVHRRTNPATFTVHAYHLAPNVG